MKNTNFGAARALLMVALPLTAIAATAQGLRSSVTSFDKQGNAIIQETSGDPNRSSVTSFDKEGNAVITYTSPPVLLNGKTQVGAPNPNPGSYNRFGYNAPSNNGYYNNGYGNNGYGNYPPNFGYPAPGYPFPNYPAFPVQNNAYTVPLGQSPYSWSQPNSLTVVPLTPGYAYPAPYGVPAYPYPVPAYPYPAPIYNYPVPQGYPYPYGYGNGTYTSNSTGYGFSFGRGGFSASIGGNNTTTRSSTSIMVR